ncbi:hypothetical protein CR51_22625 [Caballeronia megalochromosomata]|nr:hypothetical protein CR51_22625 [Caballeronia megalochromosomata]
MSRHGDLYGPLRRTSASGDVHPISMCIGLLLLQQVQRDVDDHVLQVSDRSAFAQVDEDVDRLEAGG